MSDHDEELGEEDGSESEEIRITKVLDRRQEDGQLTYHVLLVGGEDEWFDR